jgi:hypothetical protein
MPQKLTCAHSRRQLLANAAIAASRVMAAMTENLQLRPIEN